MHKIGGSTPSIQILRTTKKGSTDHNSFLNHHVTLNSRHKIISFVYDNSFGRSRRGDKVLGHDNVMTHHDVVVFTTTWRWLLEKNPKV